MLTIQRKPKLVKAFAQLNAAVTDPAGEVDLGLRSLIDHLASKAAGRLYCQAHTLLGAKNSGVSEEKHAAVWTYVTRPLFAPTERSAFDFAVAAQAVGASWRAGKHARQ